MIWNRLQGVLPQHAISRVVGSLANSRRPWLSRTLIRSFVRLYRPDLSEAVDTDPLAYPSFNALFTRALRPDARPQSGDADVLTSPVDGTLSEFGRIERGRLLQAKHRSYSLAALLGHDDSRSNAYLDGAFATIYLAPYNYHRIHMPAPGRPVSMTLVPGRLFSVSAATAAGIDELFARNERVVCHFDDERGPFTMVLVGALNVGSIDTVWHGTVTPPRGRRRRDWHYTDADALARGDEMGRFNLGSTVILLLPPGCARLDAQLETGSTLRVGQRIGHWSNDAGED